MIQILYFSTRWCQPCITMAPVINEAQKFISIQKIDAEMDPGLVNTYKVRRVPTFVFLKDGAEVGRKNGAMSIAEFKKVLTL